MLNYHELNRRWRSASSEMDLEGYLIGIWIDDYFKAVKFDDDVDVVEVEVKGFSYLFDIIQERLIAAWGISRGKMNESRDKKRMRRHPQSAGKRYHRGHAIAHQLGGITDINLVSQRGSINIGQFRVLENRAAKTPGSLYFTNWIYKDINNQKPSAVQQGLLCPGQDAELRWFPN
ncbi:DNA/RNA non-specific endonuclease [Desulfosarcina sp.]|nr:DNA/RNA non-specific endonuclease [Desulfosarcina sp.]